MVVWLLKLMEITIVSTVQCRKAGAAEESGADHTACTMLICNLWEPALQIE